LLSGFVDFDQELTVRTSLDPHGSPRSGSLRTSYAEHRFSVLLIIVVVLLAGPPALLGFGMAAGWFHAAMSILMLVVTLSFCFERQQRLFFLLLGIPSILFSAASYMVSGTFSRWTLFLGHLCEMVFLFGAAVLIVKSLFRSRAITFDGIFGAICGYLFLGLAWAILYAMIEGLHPGSFEMSRSIVFSDARAALLPNVLTYYSFVTLTTVGFGDVVAVTPITRTCAWIEAVTGQFYLAVIVAGLVSLLVASANRPAGPAGPNTREDAV
jgi:hypothetical protein